MLLAASECSLFLGTLQCPLLTSCHVVRSLSHVDRPGVGASGHLSPVISHVREDNSRRLQQPAVPATPSPYFSQKVQTRKIVPFLYPVQIPKPQKHEHDKMVIVWVVT